jgi:hypothetical protein
MAGAGRKDGGTAVTRRGKKANATRDENSHRLTETLTGTEDSQRKINFGVAFSSAI